jgi:hypothetical protein
MIPYLRHFPLPLTTHRIARYSAHLFPRPGLGLQWFVGPDPRPPLYPIRLVGPGPPAFLISLIYGKISHFDTNCVGYKGNHSLGLNPFVNLRSANLPGLLLRSMSFVPIAVRSFQTVQSLFLRVLLSPLRFCGRISAPSYPPL